jgi:prepilin-type processing-associated H-X9-DG protein
MPQCTPTQYNNLKKLSALRALALAVSLPWLPFSRYLHSQFPHFFKSSIIWYIFSEVHTHSNWLTTHLKLQFPSMFGFSGLFNLFCSNILFIYFLSWSFLHWNLSSKRVFIFFVAISPTSYNSIRHSKYSNIFWMDGRMNNLELTSK